jgi:hypothetical protein
VCILDAPDHYARSAERERDGGELAYVPFAAVEVATRHLAVQWRLPTVLTDIVADYMDRLALLQYALGNGPRDFAHCAAQRPAVPDGCQGTVSVAVMRECTRCRRRCCADHYERRRKRCVPCGIEVRLCDMCGVLPRECELCSICEQCHPTGDDDTCDNLCVTCGRRASAIHGRAECLECTRCAACCGCAEFSRTEAGDDDPVSVGGGGGTGGRGRLVRDGGGGDEGSNGGDDGDDDLHVCASCMRQDTGRSGRLGCHYCNRCAECCACDRRPGEGGDEGGGDAEDDGVDVDENEDESAGAVSAVTDPSGGGGGSDIGGGGGGGGDGGGSDETENLKGVDRGVVTETGAGAGAGDDGGSQPCDEDGEN